MWLSLDQMARLFDRDKSTISRHISKVFAEGELKRAAVVAKYATTAADGKSYRVEHFNLDVIISVGYRVKSLRGTQFRIWATGRLREFLVKGFTIDDARLKEAGNTRYTEVAKNYLREDELDVLNRIVTAYLELAELQAMNRVAMTMQDWLGRLQQFLTMTGRDILDHAGKISRDQALEKAHREYVAYKQRRLEEPSEPERHFVEQTEKELKALEARRKEE